MYTESGVASGDAELVGEVAVLLRTGVWSPIHRLAAEDATRTAGGDDGGGIATQLACLRPRQPADEPRIVVAFDLQVVGDDDEAVPLLVETQFHAASTELTTRGEVEFDRFVPRREVDFPLRELVEHLLQRPAEGVELLFFHPDNEGLAIDDREEAEPSLTRLADRLHPRPLRVPCFPIPRRHFDVPSPFRVVVASNRRHP